LVFLDEASREAEESFELIESEDVRGVKTGLWMAEVGARWLGRRGGVGEYALLTEGVPEGVESPERRSSHIAMLRRVW